MRRSIRQTLTLWYVGILAIILTVFGWVLYRSVSGSLARSIDRTLVVQAAGLADSVHAFWRAEQAVLASGQGNWASAPPTSLREEITRGGFADLLARWAEKTGSLEDGRPIRLLDIDGKALLTSTGFRPLDIPLSPDVVSEALRGRVVYETMKTPNGRLRLVTRPVFDGSPALYLVQMSAPLAQMDASLSELRAWLLWLIPLTLLVTSSIGWFLATAVLRPVGHIISQAQRISAGHLDERIDVPTTGDELQHLGATFNDMLARLERDFNRLRQFSAAASHELRTPLTVMRGELEVALRKPRESDEYQRVLRTHLDTVNEMAHTIEELLTLARSESMEAAVEWRPVELGELAHQVSRTWQRYAEPKAVQVEVPVQERVWVRGERRLLERIVANLLDNAIRHTPPQGRITVETRRAGEHACLIVRDTGPGIAPDELPHIFNRFFKPWSSADGDRPAGLGLGLCRWIVEAHHGRIEVTSPPGQGAQFTVFLPVLPAPA
jgi:heavy metal sensor kinase